MVATKSHANNAVEMSPLNKHQKSDDIFQCLSTKLPIITNDTLHESVQIAEPKRR